ncbi:DoxX family protein [Cytobacillus oceanisediminis]|uniref:Putative membrane protein YphA (DoxX/SURF4 family) n=1 Tax=Cytobacillus oceanisediminis TaxID=665099 RepID=A0A562K700_9BACI|nr:DoxX family protein [Cytobacillus oceanisediminis]TWH91187.1 putative membrane protein YphA (DoxX/SURF4 family) [Cytobacillus oceanisediminis]
MIIPSLQTTVQWYTAGWFSSIGLPGFLATVVTAIELVGGIALVLGLFSRAVSALFVLLMAGAIIKVKLAGGFLGNGQGAGYELDLALLAMAATIAITGSKLFALDQMVFRGKENSSNSTSIQ